MHAQLAPHCGQLLQPLFEQEKLEVATWVVEPLLLETLHAVVGRNEILDGIRQRGFIVILRCRFGLEQLAFVHACQDIGTLD